MNFKISKRFILIAAIFLLIFAGFIYHRVQEKKTLHVGIFAGSNWEVPQGETYSIIDEAIRKFETAHDGIKVEYVSGIKKEDYAEWLAEQFIAGNEPDVFFLLSDDFNLYASMGALMDLTKFIEQDKTFDPDVYYPAAFRYGTFEKISYALPYESTLTFMFVNKTLLFREGIEMPKNNWTWQDFLDICKKVTKDTDGDGKLDQFGCYGYSWTQAAVSNDISLFREDGKSSYFADVRMEETIRFLIDLKNIQQGYDVTPKDFDVGRVAFHPFTFAVYRTYKPYPWRIKKYSSFEWDCIKMPAGSSGGNISTLNTLLVAMSSRTNNEKLAWEFMKMLCYDKTMQQVIFEKSHALPVRRDVIMSTDAHEIFSWDSTNNNAMTTMDISNSMDEAIMPSKFKNYNVAMLYADSEITKIIDELVPFNNALNKLQKEINAFLQH